MEGLDGFKRFEIETAATVIHGRYGGDGEPVLLLHGIPETHLMWRDVAPVLADHFTVVATDLRGFGDSGKPSSTRNDSPYSMRDIARDQVEVMQSLGFDGFSVVGHDRGARCAYGMALDGPDVVSNLAVLDIIPTGDAFDRADMQFALGFWVWSFLAAPPPVPEQLIASAPAVLVNHMLDAWSASPDTFREDVRAEYAEKFRDPETVHAICEQYRAAATIDYAHDKADKGRRRIHCPLLVLWSEHGFLHENYDPIAIWRDWAEDVKGQAIPAGHFLPEEAPDTTAGLLLDFLLDRSRADCC